MKKNALYLLLTLLLISRCFIYSSLQDGNTLGKKNVAIAFSLHGVKGTVPELNPDNEKPDEDPTYKPIVQ